ncbi:mitochondrial ribosomal subunit protein-domain-containing protein [Crucibulum laeve]|uniref:Mitochondrial ribosomal subunit protein-domain-containing protein n=1 Tax=Crucibulum laeve TaxID=68775 RepID=A0A5C3M8S1_9AGAR|nr:mitochondrial ribosomal subunit protein-domain-containing protein [Crucibulum laeve]
MASSLGRLLGLPSFRASNFITPVLRQFGTSSPAQARRTKSVLEEEADEEELYNHISDPADYEDTPSGGHIILRQQRQTLHYLRLIEHEIPKLVAYRKPFVLPTPSTPLIVRSIDYAGEPHPASIKRIIVVPVDQLPLKNASAVNAIKVLAGSRWTPNPPADAGISGLSTWGNGYIKIACEDFPQPAMNLKWASDTLDRLITEANKSRRKLSDVPVDMRHVYAKARKAKKGDHLRNRVLNRPSVMDFPQEWLPPSTTS